jgi:hypothetical protein
MHSGKLMKSRLLFLLPVTLALLLGACSANGNAPAAETPLEVITLQTTPSLAFKLPEVAECANGLPGVGVYTKLLPISDLDPTGADVTIRLGNPLDTDPFVTVLGTENLVVIAGPDVSVNQLSLESVQAIFTGDVTDWRNIPEASEMGLTDIAPITLLSYHRGNDLRSHFAEIYLKSAQLSDVARGFSTSDTLTALLEENPAAITYALASQVPPTARILPIRGEEDFSSDIFVIAITPNEPLGPIRSLLLCLQDAP